MGGIFGIVIFIANLRKVSSLPEKLLNDYEMVLRGVELKPSEDDRVEKTLNYLIRQRENKNIVFIIIFMVAQFWPFLTGIFNYLALRSVNQKLKRIVAAETQCQTVITEVLLAKASVPGKKWKRQVIIPPKLKSKRVPQPLKESKMFASVILSFGLASSYWWHKLTKRVG